MSDVEFDFSELEELNKKLRKFMDSTEDLKEINAAAVKPIEIDAERRVPKKTGRLKATIRSSGQAKDGVVRAGKKSVPYGPPIHWGWKKRKIKASLFMTKARDAKLPEAIDIMDKGLGELAKKILK